jgi:AcrR family transcriptional regulator
VARTLFAERGYHETSIQDILDGAGIARGTFYLHFDSKRAIFDLLIDDFLVRLQDVLTPVDVQAGAPAPLVQLTENLARVILVLHDRRDLTRIILLLAEGLDAECDAKMAEFYSRVLDLLAGAIGRGQKLNLVRPCDPRIVAQAALGSLKEVMLQWIVRRDSTQDELHHVCHEILAYSLHGLFNPAR